MDLSNTRLMESRGPPCSGILRTTALSNEKPSCDRTEDRNGHTFLGPV
jgi:hypothetical protein